MPSFQLFGVGLCIRYKALILPETVHDNAWRYDKTSDNEICLNQLFIFCVESHFSLPCSTYCAIWHVKHFSFRERGRQWLCPDFVSFRLAVSPGCFLYGFFFSSSLSEESICLRGEATDLALKMLSEADVGWEECKTVRHCRCGFCD